jgi:hypothetical protein
VSALKWWRIFAPVALVAGMSGAGALAQTPLKAWPEQQPQMQSQQPRAWPGEGPGQQASAPPAPMAAPPAPMMMAPPMGGGMGGPPQGGGSAEQQACGQEFVRLKGEVEKKGLVAKAVNEKKGTREDMCGAISGIHTAQTAWVKWAQDNSKKCGIPPDIIKTLKLGQTNLAKVRSNVCSGGPATAAAPATPSLSEALGTARIPPNSVATEKKRGGVLDTMTGTAIR